MDEVTLTREECCKLYAQIDELAGGNAHSLFAWDGTDDQRDPLTAALAKVFVAAGYAVPPELRRE